MKAAHHLPLRPGTNVAVVTAIAHVIVTEGLMNEAFIRDRLCGGITHHTPQVTGLLLRWAQGDATALGRLIPLVHQELHRIARRCMAGERSGHSLQATALVNEAYVHLVDGKAVEWHDRAHFLAVSARVMRHILVDHARARRAQKRRGVAARVTFDEALVVTDEPRQDFAALWDWGAPGDLVAAPTGRLYVADRLSGRIHVFGPTSEPAW